MKWIKASERLPEVDGLYFVKCYPPAMDSYKTLLNFEIGQFNPIHNFEIEWLDEQPFSDKDKEIERKESERKSWADMCIKKQARIEELEKENFHLSAEITYVSDGYNRSELNQKIERLKGLIETLFKKYRETNNYRLLSVPPPKKKQKNEPK